VRFVAFGPDRDAEPLAPGQYFDILLAAVKPAVAVLGIQQETIEITEPVEEQTGDLARERPSLCRGPRNK
jgi:hypothetical protein